LHGGAVDVQQRVAGLHADQRGLSCVGGMNITSVDPLLRDVARRDLRLRSGSPSADAGRPALIGSDRLDLDGDAAPTERLPLDFDNRPRFADDPATPGQATVGLGAFES